MESTVRRIVGPTILTRSGHYFDFDVCDLGPRPLLDIASALSKLCRFTGHCRRFYSVAEHSVHASHIVAPEFRREALLHDAAEAYVGDVAKPLKGLLPEYKIIEQRVEAAICSRFRLPATMSPEVKVADRAMLRVEQIKAMGNDDAWADLDREIQPVTLRFCTPDRAEHLFLRRCAELGVYDAGQPQ